MYAVYVVDETVLRNILQTAGGIVTPTGWQFLLSHFVLPVLVTKLSLIFINFQNKHLHGICLVSLARHWQ